MSIYDLEITTKDGKKFNYSKYILSLVSPVFHTMFTCGMKESHQNSITIPYDSTLVKDIIILIEHYARTFLTMEKSTLDLEHSIPLARKRLEVLEYYQMTGISYFYKQSLYKVTDIFNIEDINLIFDYKIKSVYYPAGNWMLKYVGEHLQRLSVNALKKLNPDHFYKHAFNWIKLHPKTEVDYLMEYVEHKGRFWSSYRYPKLVEAYLELNKL